MKRGKKYLEKSKLVNRANLYDVNEACALIPQLSTAKFDETVEAHIRLGVDSRHADQQVRGAVVLPHGTGKTVRVLVFAKGAKADEAEAAGLVGRLGRVLGPKGLMPNPKAGTVTMDVTKAIEEIKAGKIEYRLDKTNIIHVPVGKVSFGAEKLQDNFKTLMSAIIKARPAAAKGTYLKSVVLTTTMGPSVKINAAKLAD